MRGHLRTVRTGIGTELGTGPIRVVLAEDHQSLRRNLRLLLEREADLVVVGEAGDLETAVVQVGAQQPDVVVLDLRLPDGSGAEPIERLRQQSPRTEIVVITMTPNEMIAEAAFRAGALGFVLKDSADLELCDAVRRAARGWEYRSPRVMAS